ncbi:TetR/AcrR family transcriptional regulator [Rhodanobacter sp. AS-Z3]|uniref:TetR/AcrR family transcriptional regulator n=1 Tax=Rhodanobacter sp. AS-Z3 TaxID=3031330 RepID=UPI00247848A2|nr:TetR/AcrR family transcriptional regulator [Rhodanobacter sp. AS-Z3]WEN14255.1 TetR/AcrR family transcriptional regulator [Rhodanobacter sp. AS-Z3]
MMVTTEGTAARIMDVAEALIQQRGYGGFSFDDVAQQVGIRKPSVHHHFRTKSDLVAALAQRYTERFESALAAIDIARRDPLARLKAYVRLFATTYAQDSRLCLCGMLGAEADALPEDVAAAVATFFELNLVWLAAAFRDAQHSGQVTSALRAQALAELLLSTLEGAMVVGRGARGGSGPAAVGKTLLGGLAA